MPQGASEDRAVGTRTLAVLEGGDPRPAVSIVVTCFEEADTLAEFHERLAAAVDQLDRTAEIIYVNDGSADGTLALLEAIFERDTRVTGLVDLAWNVGKTNAMTPGIACGQGEDFAFLDCDLQLAPEDLGRLLIKFDEGHDVVSGFRSSRKDNGVRRVTSRLGNWVVGRFSGVALRDLGCGFKVIRGELLRAFHFGPHTPLDPGQVLMGLRSVAEVEVAHEPRSSGRSRWTLRRFFTLYSNILSSMVPVLFPSIAVALVLGLTVVFLHFVNVLRFPEEATISLSPTITPLLVILSMMLNLVFFVVLGEFWLLGRTRAARPAYVVRKLHQRPFVAKAVTVENNEAKAATAE